MQSMLQRTKQEAREKQTMVRRLGKVRFEAGKVAAKAQYAANDATHEHELAVRSLADTELMLRELVRVS